MKGIVFDKNKVPKYELKGNWQNKLVVVNLNTKEEATIWEKQNFHEQNFEEFYFTLFAKQLNHINNDLMKNIVATDSRFRLDMRFKIIISNFLNFILNLESFILKKKKKNYFLSMKIT